MQGPNTTYETATGKIEYTLKSDLMFHYVMQKSKAALTHLVCALKGIDPRDVKEIIVQNYSYSAAKVGIFLDMAQERSNNFCAIV